MDDPLDGYWFVCRGCHVRYRHAGQCANCGSEIVVEAEWPLDESGSMMPPRPRRHVLAVGIALGAAMASIALAWGTTTLWGVVPCAVITVALLLSPVSTWDKADVSDELSAMTRLTTSDGHALQDGAARELTAINSSRRPVGCAGMFFGVLLPLVVVRPGEPATVAAGILAVVGFVVAWARRVRREAEAAAGRGVPL